MANDAFSTSVYLHKHYFSFSYCGGCKPSELMSIDHSSPPRKELTSVFPGCPMPFSISLRLASC